MGARVYRKPDELKRYADNLWLVPWKRFGFSYCCVYLMAPFRKRPVKVGISNDPNARLCEIQISHWEPIFVHRAWICESFGLARKVELAVHKMLDREELKLKGEWFDLTIADAAKAVEHAGLETNIELASRLPETEKFEPVFEFLDAAIPKKAKHTLRKIRKSPLIETTSGAA